MNYCYKKVFFLSLFPNYIKWDYTDEVNKKFAYFLSYFLINKTNKNTQRERIYMKNIFGETRNYKMHVFE